MKIPKVNVNVNDLQYSSNTILHNIEDRINRDRSDLSEQEKKELLDKIRLMEERLISIDEINQAIDLYKKH